VKLEVVTMKKVARVKHHINLDCNFNRKIIRSGITNLNH